MTEETMMSKSVEQICNEVGAGAKIMEEFENLYKERLRVREQSGESKEHTVRTLEEWVKDLTEQNKLLVKTVEELEREAINRVTALDKLTRLQKIDEEDKKTFCAAKEKIREMEHQLTLATKNCCAKENENKCLMLKNSELQKELNALMSNSHKLEETLNSKTRMENQIKQLNSELTNNKKQIEELKDCLNKKNEEIKEMKLSENKVLSEYKKQCEHLKKILESRDDSSRNNIWGGHQDEMDQRNTRSRTSAHDICNYQEEDRDLEEYDNRFHPYDKQPQFSEQSSQVAKIVKEKLEIDITIQTDKPAKQKICQNLKPYKVKKGEGDGGGIDELDELKRKLEEKKDLHLALTSEVAEKHDTIVKLKDQVKDLEEQLRQSDMQTHFKDDIIRQLRKEVKLGRAKESLATMLGLKDGPRVQMKAKIDYLHAELEDRNSEIARLENRLEKTCLESLESRLRVQSEELGNRNRSMLEMCDKIDYVRRYIEKLQSEEPTNIKYGLEALLSELKEDIEFNKETRRNASLSLHKEPSDSIIIINHRSHSLPDATLKKQMYSMISATDSLSFHKKPTEQKLYWTTNGQPKNGIDTATRLESVGRVLDEKNNEVSALWDSMKALDEKLVCTKDLEQLKQSLEEEKSVMKRTSESIHSIIEHLSSTVSNVSAEGFLVEELEKNVELHDEDTEKQSCETEVVRKRIPRSVLTALTDTVSSVSKKIQTIIDMDNTKKVFQDFQTVLVRQDQIIQKVDSIKELQISFSQQLGEKFVLMDMNLKAHKNIVNEVKTLAECVKEKQQEEKVSSAGSLKKIESTNLFSTLENGDEPLLTNSFLNNGHVTDGVEDTQNDNSQTDTGTSYYQIVQLVDSLHTEIRTCLDDLQNREKLLNDIVNKGSKLHKALSSLQNDLTAAQPVIKNYNRMGNTVFLKDSVSSMVKEIHNILMNAEEYNSKRDLAEAKQLISVQKIGDFQDRLLKVLNEYMAAVECSRTEDTDQCNKWKEEIKEYRAQVNQLKEIESERKTNLEQLEEMCYENKALKKEVDDLNQLNGTLKLERSHLEEMCYENKALKKEIEDLNQLNETLKLERSHLEEMCYEYKALTKEVEDLKQLNETFKLERSHLALKEFQVKETSQNVKKQLKEKQAELEKSEAELQDKRFKLLEMGNLQLEIKSLKTRLNSEENLKQRQLKEMDMKNEEIKQLKGRINLAEKQSVELQHKIHDLLIKKTKIEEENSKLRAEIKDKQKLEKEHQDVMDELQAKVCNLQESLEHYTSKSQESRSWFLSWPQSRQSARHIHDV